MSNQPNSRRAMLKGIKADIKKYGFKTIGVLGDGFDGSFAYTVGLEATYGHPELLMTGIGPDTAHFCFERLLEQVLAGSSLNFDDVMHGACRFPMQIRRVNSKRACEEHMLLTKDFYGGSDEFQVLQLVYPDPKGVFPWQEGYDFPQQELLFDLDK